MRMYIKHISKFLLFVVLASFVTLITPPGSVRASDVERILYTTGDNEIISINPEGTDRQDLGPGFQLSPSPDHQKVAFLRYESGSLNLYVMNLDGSNVVQVAANTWPGSFDAPNSKPTWSPDSTQLIFARSYPSPPKFSSDIFRISIDGTNEVNLTNLPSALNYNPQWAPDGSKVVFTRLQNNISSIYTMNPDGSNIEQVAPSGYMPTWSPDGSNIAFYMNTAQSQLHTINPDGTNDTLVFDFVDSNYPPAWSPDGSRIAIKARYLGNNTEYRITLVAADGSDPIQPLGPPRQADLMQPSWSPDGSAIIFLRYDPFGGSPLNYRLYTMPLSNLTMAQVAAEPEGSSINSALWIGPPRTPLPAPTNLTVTSTPTESILEWDAVDGADHYRVFRDYTEIAVSPITAFSDTDAADGTHTYVVTAIDSSGRRPESPFSNKVTVTVDRTAPTITATVSPTPNAAGWNNANVTVSFACEGAVSCPSPVIISSDGQNQVVTRSVFDEVGNAATASVTVNLDKTAPVVSNPSISPFFSFPSRNMTISANTNDSLSGVSKGEFYIDTDPGQGSGQPLNYLNGTLSAWTTFNNLHFGIHRVFIRSQDMVENWSPPVSSYFFFI